MWIYWNPCKAIQFQLNFKILQSNTEGRARRKCKSRLQASTPWSRAFNRNWNEIATSKSGNVLIARPSLCLLRQSLSYMPHQSTVESCSHCHSVHSLDFPTLCRQHTVLIKDLWDRLMLHSLHYTTQVSKSQVSANQLCDLARRWMHPPSDQSSGLGQSVRILTPWEYVVLL